MKKSFLSIFVMILFLSVSSVAQTKITVNGGLQLPTGNMKTTLESGYGGNVTLDYSLPLLPVSLAFTAGYNRWNFKNITPSENFYSVPLMVGGRFYTGGIYVGADLGFAFSNSSFTGSSSSTDFTISPIVGYRLNLTPVGLVALDLNVRYWNVSTAGSSSTWIGLNAGVAIGF